MGGDCNGISEQHDVTEPLAVQFGIEVKIYIVFRPQFPLPLFVHFQDLYRRKRSDIMASQVFFITGTSTGFGYELVKKCLAEGDKVVATARNSSKLKFDGTTKDNFLAVDCDVTSEKSIDAAFDAAIKQFKRVDVVCNNAGYGLSGEFESLSDKQIRTQVRSQRIRHELVHF